MVNSLYEALAGESHDLLALSYWEGLLAKLAKLDRELHDIVQREKSQWMLGCRQFVQGAVCAYLDHCQQGAILGGKASSPW